MIFWSVYTRVRLAGGHHGDNGPGTDNKISKAFECLPLKTGQHYNLKILAQATDSISNILEVIANIISRGSAVFDGAVERGAVARPFILYAVTSRACHTFTDEQKRNFGDLNNRLTRPNCL